LTVNICDRAFSADVALLKFQHLEPFALVIVTLIF